VAAATQRRELFEGLTSKADCQLPSRSTMSAVEVSHKSDVRPEIAGSHVTHRALPQNRARVRLSFTFKSTFLAARPLLCPSASVVITTPCRATGRCRTAAGDCTASGGTSNRSGDADACAAVDVDLTASDWDMQRRSLNL